MLYFTLAVLLLLLCALISFAVGRRIGFTHGVSEGCALCHIELREQSYRHGTCPTCDRS